MRRDNLRDDNPVPSTLPAGEVFARLVEPHLGVLFACAAALVGTADAEDAAQEAILRAWQAWSTVYEMHDAPGAPQKAELVGRLGAESVIAVGNGRNDVAMLTAALGIAVLGAEGCAGAALRAADVVVPSISDALDCLLEPRRLVATLRP